MISYNWPSLPYDLIKDDYRKNLSQWTLRVARYTPGLLYWWFTQKIFPSSSVIERNPKFFSNKDLEVLKNSPAYQLFNQVTLFILSAKKKGKEILQVTISVHKFKHECNQHCQYNFKNYGPV